MLDESKLLDGPGSPSCSMLSAAGPPRDCPGGDERLCKPGRGPPASSPASQGSAAHPSTLITTTTISYHTVPHS